MNQKIRRLLTITPLAVLVTWLVPGVAHAGWQNHNETLVSR